MTSKYFCVSLTVHDCMCAHRPADNKDVVNILWDTYIYVSRNTCGLRALYGLLLLLSSLVAVLMLSISS